MAALSKQTTEVTVRKLQRSDMIRFLKWGHHQDVRFQHYDFPAYNYEELQLWYQSKSKFLRRFIYIAEDQSGNLLGYMTIKHINWLKQRAEMGIVFNPDLVGKGFGTASIKALYHIYFNHLKMKSLYLKVADFNTRARRCYEKAGFIEIGEQVEPFEEQERNFELLLKTDDFFMRKNVLYTLFHYMEITKEQWKQMDK